MREEDERGEEMRKHHLKIMLPWPDTALSPNARCHWAVKRKAVKSARRVSYFETILKTSGKRAAPIGSISYRCSFFPPDRRARDEDNLLASMKSSLDGIAEALRVNDKCFHILEPFVGVPERPGRVEVDLYWKEEH